MKRNLLCVFSAVMILILILLIPSLGLAASPESDFEAVEFMDGFGINKYIGPGGAVEVPSTIQGKPVIKIGNGAFYKCTSVTSVTLPSSITGIGDGAFMECSNLTSVNIPSGITSIYIDTFTDCVSLKEITIPSSVDFIDGRAFNNCTGLTSVTFGGDLSFVPEGIFDSVGWDTTCVLRVPDTWTEWMQYETEVFFRGGIFNIILYHNTTFDGNGADDGFSLTIMEYPEELYIMPEKDPVRAGFTFAGWFTEKNGGTQITANDILEIGAPDTLYAHWIPDIYNIIIGMNQTVATDADSAKFASDADFSKFDHVEVDGKTVAIKYYTAETGSTVITFNQEFIKTLSIGEHKLTIVSKDGKASTTFMVNKPLPKTGDSTNLMLLALLLLISTGAILMVSVKAAKKES